MLLRQNTSLRVTAALLTCLMAPVSQAADDKHLRIQTVVESAVRPVLEKFAIPGMSVGVVVAGTPHFFNFGIASKDTGQPVSEQTLFELGSISKTFTATAATYAQLSGQLSLADKTRKYLPGLDNRPFGNVTLLSLGTHTPGGLPLQVPDNIRDEQQLMDYFQAWQPTCDQGTCRTYANPGIGMLGLITAKAAGVDFPTLMEQQLFPALGLENSYIQVPEAKFPLYAQGYTVEDKPARMATAVLSAEAYGIKSSAADLTRFMQANMQQVKIDQRLQQAITDTHTGYFLAGGMIQDLIWEQYPMPVSLAALQAGNAADMIYNATPVTAIEPPQPPRADVWINKTGGTRGFGSYIAFIPQKQLGIVILANKNYPNAARVDAAYQILTALADD
ncbi:class C beta-lactamase [Pseudomonas petrae]|uniref:Beta-lactamase n=1 Tax=Pseudomonas petrae TaxID=2912190 RepID=A0ABS9IC94_9PSED|nr:class C beta-lactamase [Pseudomonas petrae]MCF7530781.1 beta-lactamase [Pseudomonas petrae]MCF7536454.1 beta-lactamase [Pseudomonas petrae]MCF7545338.1 beta-lactamase [Pseudomonas petrae]MCF7554133.1 beta-lactamase [Pseudomonas petrae]